MNEFFFEEKFTRNAEKTLVGSCLDPLKTDFEHNFISLMNQILQL